MQLVTESLRGFYLWLMDFTLKLLIVLFGIPYDQLPANEQAMLVNDVPIFWMTAIGMFAVEIIALMGVMTIFGRNSGEIKLLIVALCLAVIGYLANYVRVAYHPLGDTAWRLLGVDALIVVLAILYLQLANRSLWRWIIEILLGFLLNTVIVAYLTWFVFAPGI